MRLAPTGLFVLFACTPQPHTYPDPGAWGPTAGPGAPKRSYTEEELWTACAYLEGGEGDAEHHNLVGLIDGYLYMPWAPESGGGGLSVFDFSDPCAPVLLGETWADGFRESHTLATGVVGGRRYLAVAYHVDGDTGGVGFFDISDPTAPAWASSLELPAYSYPDAYFRVVLSTFWVGDYVYAGAGLNGVFVIDVTDPLQPALLGQHAAVGHMVGPVQVIGDLAVVSSGGLARTILYDLSDPEVFEPIAGGDFDTVDAVGEVRKYYFSNIGGHYGLFARNSNGGGPIVYDLSDPSNPTWVSDAPSVGGDGAYVFQQNDHLFLGDSNFGTVYDFSDPTAPTPIGEVNLQGDLDTVTPVGNVVVVSVDDGAASGQATAVIPWSTTPDTQGPRLGWARPPDGAVWVPTSTRIGVAMDEAIEPISAFEGSFRVWTAQGEPVPGRFYVQDTLINFVPDAPLAAETTYVVEVPAGGLADGSGNRVQQSTWWSFSTGPELEEVPW